MGIAGELGNKNRLHIHAGGGVAARASPHLLLLRYYFPRAAGKADGGMGRGYLEGAFPGS